MDKPKPDIVFHLMCFMMKLRDIVITPKSLLDAADIRTGQSVLDYGCGPGMYTFMAARLVGPCGMIHALDIQPLALRKIAKQALRQGMNNVWTIQSNCATGLDTASIDRVLLYDNYHMFSDPGSIMVELHRVLKPDGILSFSDHHLKESVILEKVAHTGLFKLMNKGRLVYTYAKASHVPISEG